MKAIPEVGRFYHFWDDGKTSPSRHYICRVERVVSPNVARSIKVMVPEWHYGTNETEYVETTLYDHWKIQVANHDWLYADDTDYFVEASCPNYDEHNLWFIRTKNGGWFSMDVQSSWQGGRLDIDGKIYESCFRDWIEWNKCSSEEALKDYVPATEENWKNEK